jgi:hypothetical protein
MYCDSRASPQDVSRVRGHPISPHDVVIIWVPWMYVNIVLCIIITDPMNTGLGHCSKQKRAATTLLVGRLNCDHCACLMCAKAHVLVHGCWIRNMRHGSHGPFPLKKIMVNDHIAHKGELKHQLALSTQWTKCWAIIISEIVFRLHFMWRRYTS